MRVFDFDHAILRFPGRSVVNGLRSDRDATPDFENVKREHADYAAALRAAGLAVEILPPLENYPDSVFVEDPALVLPEGAVVLRPSALTRRGEAGEMRDTLRRHFAMVEELSGEEWVDGGDVFVTPARILIGLSQRTNRLGAEALCAILARFGRKAAVAQTPQGVLHFKSAVSLLGEDMVLATARMAASGVFSAFKVLTVPDAEEAAANALRVNDTILVGAQYPRTCEMITREGFDVVALSVIEIAKLDAGLSCMSLRWSAGA